MAARTLQLGMDDAIQRGDRWEHDFHMTELIDGVWVGVDVSGYDWTLVFAHDRHTVTEFELVAAVNKNYATDPDNRLTATIEGVDTATIPYNLLEGELQAGDDDTWLKILVPVVGQINTTSA